MESTYRPSLAWRRNLLALAVAAQGIIDLASAILSHPPARLVALLRIVPTAVLDTSRTFTLLAGALLLVTAWGLRRGKRRAFVAALFLCAVSVPVNMLKALDFEEAMSATVLMFALGISGDAFRVKSRELSMAALGWRAIAWTAGLISYAVLGCWILESLYGPGGSFTHAIAESAYRLLGIGQPALALRDTLSLHAQRMTTWFLNSLSVLGLMLVIALSLSALRPVRHKSRHVSDAARVAELCERYADSSVAAFALEPETDYFFSANGRAVVAYRFESDTLLCVGDPIGPEEEILPLLRAFSDHCAERDWSFAFFQARPERLPTYQALGWRALHIGEDPILWTDRFHLEGSAMGDVRRSARKLEAAGMTAVAFHPARNPLDPEHETCLLDELRAVSNEWLGTHRGVEKGFCMGRFDPTRFRRAWLVAAWNPERSRVEAFTTWVPVWARRGWALDLMRRRTDAPSGVMEFLVVRSVQAAKEVGDTMLSLSLSPLAKVGPPQPPQAGGGDRALGEGAPERARAFLMQHLSRFYDFRNLFRWKEKFAPAYEDRFLIFPEPLALPRVALALARAQSAGGIRGYFRSGWRESPRSKDPEASGTAESRTG